jgi:hypothetical protein
VRLPLRQPKKFQPKEKKPDTIGKNSRSESSRIIKRNAMGTQLTLVENASWKIGCSLNRRSRAKHKIASKNPEENLRTKQERG